MTAADENKNAMDRVLEEFRGFLVCLDDVSEKGAICAAGVWQKGDILSTDYIKEAYEKGHTIGLHTYSHKYDQVYASVDAYFCEESELDEVLRTFGGVDLG